MATTAPIRAKAKVITAISARSRRPTSVDTSMLSSSSRACSLVSTEVLPFLTTCFGPRTAAAGFGPAKICPTIKPVEQHADRREVLFDGRRAIAAAQHLDVGGDMV